MPSDNESDRKKRVSRRKVLRNTAVLGTLPAAAGHASASSDSLSIDIDAILSHDDVKRLVDEIPSLKLKREETIVFGNDDTTVVIPGNHGKLLVTISDSAPGRSGQLLPDTDSADVAASFYFEQWVADFDDSWPRGTAARLSVTDDELVFERETTESEKRQLLTAINRPNFHDATTNVSVIPERGTVHFTHKNRRRREIQSVLAVVQEGHIRSSQRQNPSDTAQRELQLDVVDENSYAVSEMVPNNDVTTEATCDDQLMTDIVWCLIDYSDCALCTIGSPAPPVFAACIIIVCFDGGLSAVMEFLTDYGCISGAQRGYACLEQLVDNYGSDIPDPPDLPDPGLPI